MNIGNMVKTLILLSIFSIIFLLPAVNAINVSFTIDSPLINVTIISPTNTTYTILSNGTVNYTYIADSTLPIFHLKAYQNGNLIYDNASYANNTIINIQRNFTSFGTYNFTVYGENILGDSGTSQVIFTVAQIPSPPTPVFALVGLIPTVMAAGAIMWLVSIFMGPPKSPRELVEFTLVAVIVFFVLVTGINIIVGLI